MNHTKAEMVAILIESGWKEFGIYNGFPQDRKFYKQFDTPTRCSGNPDNVGVQILITVYEIERNVSYELQIVAGLSDGTWLDLHNYAMPKDLREGLAKIPRLLRAWEAIANDTETEGRAGS